MKRIARVSSVLALALALMLFLGACRSNENGTDTVQQPISADADGTVRLSDADYRSLNKFLSRLPQETNLFGDFGEWFLTGNMYSKTLEDRLIWIAYYVDEESFGSTSGANVEVSLYRWFGVKKIYHENSNNTAPSMNTEVLQSTDSANSFPLWVMDEERYYFDALGGDSPIGFENVTRLIDNRDGTYTAHTDAYFTYYAEVAANGDYLCPESLYAPFNEWELPADVNVITDALYDSEQSYDDMSTVVKSTSNVYVIKPFVHNGEQTWQYVSINGVKIPDVLFALKQ